VWPGLWRGSCVYSTQIALFYDTRFAFSLLVIVNSCFNTSLVRKCGSEADIVSVGSPSLFIYLFFCYLAMLVRVFEIHQEINFSSLLPFRSIDNLSHLRRLYLLSFFAVIYFFELKYFVLRDHVQKFWNLQRVLCINCLYIMVLSFLIVARHRHMQNFCIHLYKNKFPQKSQKCEGVIEFLFILYFNWFDQPIARQQIGKHLPLVLHDNNGESIVVANVTARC
jgi:hypothetical protein